MIQQNSQVDETAGSSGRPKAFETSCSSGASLSFGGGSAVHGNSGSPGHSGLRDGLDDRPGNLDDGASQNEVARRNRQGRAPIDLEAEENKKIRALLVGKTGKEEKTGLSELKGLVDTLGMEIAGSVLLKNPKPQPRYGIGSGAAESIAEQAAELEADCIIFDFEISPSHQRNWEKLASIPVFDRHEVILRIFAQRARTKEAVLQVELAKLAYSLPRLAHTYGDMARQRGGSYGAKGAGETKLELDRRGVQEKMYRLKDELEKVKKDRETNRKRRGKIPLPSCAIVGYTNAGKSSLLNALTGADVLVENKLFATLDPTTRRLPLGNGSAVLLTDTVGFIDGLPHNLVDAFKSTLEEAALADLLLIVLDSSDPAVEEQYQTVMKVLSEIKADTVPAITLLNKTDLLTDSGLMEEERQLSQNGGGLALGVVPPLSRLKQIFPDSLSISVKKKMGFKELKELISEKLLGREESYVIPLEKSYIVEEVRKNGHLISESWEKDFVRISTRANDRERNILAQYLVE